MFHRKYRWPNLLEKFLNGQLNDTEMKEFKRQKTATPWKQEQVEHFVTMKGIREQAKTPDEMDMQDWEYFKKNYINPVKKKYAHRATIKKFTIRAIAAIMLGGFITFGIYLLIQRWQKPDISHLPSLIMRDIPHGNETILILSDGTIINLDSIPDGKQIAANMPYIKRNQHLLPVQMRNATQLTANGINTLYVPAGKQYQLTLPDGTNIKLNTTSHVYFPSDFSDDNRWVGMSGEAFFEVTKYSQKPFIINIKNKMCAEVFGTSFNISAYDDNDFIKTTVLDGIIKIANLDTTNRIINSKKLLAGQQAFWGKDNLIINNNINIPQVTAWIHGEFNFDKKPLKEIMQEISRWYKVKIKYTGKIPDVTSTGALPRSMKLSEMITILEGTNQIDIKETPDSTLIVSPQTESVIVTE